ncbi:hypothetical protein VTJ83DRAFT_5342 [Remersonia thermophila]|uniref:Uncharacterized protein n=1 Tax=Remersonia thermophila TaxID=72144 RepID=A0ABR4D6J9_9PEZI
MARMHLALLLLAVLAAVASASLPSFCKCTCGQNSTIIPLGPQHGDPNPPPLQRPPPKQSSSSLSTTSSTSSSSSSSSTSTTTTTSTSPASDSTSPARANPRRPAHGIPLFEREPTNSCQQCSRAFCLKYNLPICKGVDEKDIKTSCFQRDSHKDRAIVWCFLLATGGLLGWAGVRQVVGSAKRRGGRGRHPSSPPSSSSPAGRMGVRENGRGRGTGFLGRAGRDTAPYDPLRDGDHGVHGGRGTG